MKLGGRLIKFAARNPNATAMGFGIGTGAIGDGSAQYFEGVRRVQDIDVPRMVAMCSYQACVSVLFYVPFYKFLDNKFGVDPTVKGVVSKMFLGDLFFVPFVEIPFYMSWSTVVEHAASRREHQQESGKHVTSCSSSHSSSSSDSMAGDLASALQKKLTLRHYADVCQVGLLYNIPMTFINFTLVPSPLRVAFMDVADCVWGCLLSYWSHRDTNTGSGGAAGVDCLGLHATHVQDDNAQPCHLNE